MGIFIETKFLSKSFKSFKIVFQFQKQKGNSLSGIRKGGALQKLSHTY